MLDKFIKEHIGKKNDNGYGAYPGECVSLVQRFNKVLGNPRQWGNGEAYRTNLVNNKLGVHVPLNQARSGDVIAGLNNSHIYGHVALVINSTQVLEQAGPTAGGDGIAKIGTIANFVKRYPNYKVTRLHAYKYVEPVKPINPNAGWTEELNHELVLKQRVNLREQPNTSSKIIKTLDKGARVPYTHYKGIGGYDWKKTVDGHYIASGTDKNNKLYADIVPVKVPDKPKLKSNRVIADEVKLGRWGNGAERVKRLTEAGYDAKAIQAIVDSDNGKKPDIPFRLGDKVRIKPTVTKYANDATIGKWGYKDDTIASINGDKVKLKVINSWVYAKDLERVK